MTRRRLIFLAGALALTLTLSAGTPLLAQDKGKDKGGQKKEKDPKDTPEWKECEKIGALFQAKDSTGLVDRMRKKGKLTLALGATKGDFEEKQAGPNLDTWFEGKTDLEVEMKSIRDLDGTLTLSFKHKGKDKKVTKNLVVTIEKKEKVEGYFLTKLELVG